MCALAFYHPTQESDTEMAKHLQTMISSADHRGPDDHGSWLQYPAGMAHRRLSILDPDPRAGQPMHFGPFVMIFNGCIYNYLELKEELKFKDYTFDTTSDSEVVIKAFAEWGPDCLNRFNGMWAIAIYNRQSHKLFVSRDRFGIKPLYWLQDSDRFILGSEVKQLLHFSSGNLHEETIRDYFLYGRLVHNQHTFFEDIHVFPPGSYAWYDVNQKEWNIHRFYNIEQKSTSWQPEYFRSLLTDAVRLRLRSDVPVGITLSGGLDSSVIATIAAKSDIPPAPMFTASFPGYKKDETVYAQAVGKKIDRPVFQTLSSWTEFMDSMKNLSFLHDQPIGSFAVFSGYKLQETIAEHGVKVVLNGQGADEILAGYDKFHFFYLKRLLKNNPLTFVRELGFALYRRQYNFKTILRKYQNYKQVQQTIFPNWADSQLLSEILKTESSDGQPDSDLFSMSISALYGMGLPVMLQSVDRNSMAHGVECRVPFLDHRLVEYCINLPDKVKIRRGIRKHPLRSTFSKDLPSKVTNRYIKQGFSSPQDQYMEQFHERIVAEIKSNIQLLPNWIRKNEFLSMIGNPKTHKDLRWRAWAWINWHHSIEKAHTRTSDK